MKKVRKLAVFMALFCSFLLTGCTQDAEQTDIETTDEEQVEYSEFRQLAKEEIDKGKQIIAENDTQDAIGIAKSNWIAGETNLAYALLAELSAETDVSACFEPMRTEGVLQNLEPNNPLYWIHYYYSDYPIHTGEKQETVTGPETQSTVKPKVCARQQEPSVLDSQISIFQEGDFYGYHNQETGGSTDAEFEQAWPFMDGFGCALTVGENMVLLDENFNIIWSAYDIADTAPSIGQYDNLSAADFDAQINSILNSMNGTEETDISAYFDSLEYVKNTYGENLNQYDSALASQWKTCLAEAMDYGQQMYEQQVMEYNQYYDTQIEIQNYYQDHIDSWTPNY